MSNKIYLIENQFLFLRKSHLILTDTGFEVLKENSYETINPNEQNRDAINFFFKKVMSTYEKHKDLSKF